VHTYNIDQGGEQAPTADTTNIIPIASKKPIADGIAGAMSEALITEIDAAVKAMNKADKVATTAKETFVSRSKEVGVLLLRWRELNPEETWDVIFKRVGLGHSRGFDCLKVAGGRRTDEELRQDARERQRRSRLNKKPLTPAPELPEPKQVLLGNGDIMTGKPAEYVTVTDSTQVSAEKNAAADTPTTAPVDPNLGPRAFDSLETVRLRASLLALEQFKHAAAKWLPRMSEPQRVEAVVYVRDFKVKEVV
jgi:hypothetical protein